MEPRTDAGPARTQRNVLLEDAKRKRRPLPRGYQRELKTEGTQTADGRKGGSHIEMEIPQKFRGGSAAKSEEHLKSEKTPRARMTGGKDKGSGARGGASAYMQPNQKQETTLP